MKTPREILLQKHQSAAPKLDAIRETVIAESVMGAAGQASAASPARAPFFVQMWQELFWSCRKIWGGLAAIWLAILVINAVSNDSAPSTAAAVAPGRDWMMAIQLQREMMRKLLEQDSPATPALPARRSEAREFFLIG